jgi:hypothetical protein
VDDVEVASEAAGSFVRAVLRSSYMPRGVVKSLKMPGVVISPMRFRYRIADAA